MKALHMLASLKLTLAGMILLLSGTLVSQVGAGQGDTGTSVVWLVVPLALLGANLLAALWCNPRFRRQPGLLVFHLCLAFALILVACGRLTHLEGRAEILAGQPFDPSAVEVVGMGPWHPFERLREVSFRQGDFTVNYAPGIVRQNTRSELVMSGDVTGDSIVPIGDTIPLRASGYRFYTTSNKGYAAVLTWAGTSADRATGAVHFPSYPLWDWKQVNRWRTPAGTDLELALELPEPVSERDRWTLDSRGATGALTLRWSSGEQILQPTETVRLPGGTLRFEGLRMWMGYEIAYDRTLPWLVSAALAAVLGLSWHFWQKLWMRPAAPAQAHTNGTVPDAVART